MTYDFHKEFPGSGVGKHYDFHLAQLRYAQQQYRRPIRVLDYGAGKGGTTEWLKLQGFDVTAYDPYYPANSDTERLKLDYDAIISGDVLEHIHTVDIPWDYFKTARHNIHVIDLTPAKKTLPSGENAHVNLQTQEAWRETFYTHLGGEVIEQHTYTEPDKTFGKRERLCLHIEL